MTNIIQQLMVAALVLVPLMQANQQGSLVFVVLVAVVLQRARK